MTISVKTTIGFRTPEDDVLMRLFLQSTDPEEWAESITTGGVTYSRAVFMSIEADGGEDDNQY